MLAPALLNVSALQLEQELAPAALNVPGLQMVQSPAVAALYFPAMHEEHKLEYPPPLADPGLHEVHTLLSDNVLPKHPENVFPLGQDAQP